MASSSNSVTIYIFVFNVLSLNDIDPTLHIFCSNQETTEGNGIEKSTSKGQPSASVKKETPKTDCWTSLGPSKENCSSSASTKWISSLSWERVWSSPRPPQQHREQGIKVL